MSARITRRELESLAASVNRQFGNGYFVELQGRNGGTALDLCYVESTDDLASGGSVSRTCVHSTLAFGPAREIERYLRGMQEALFIQSREQVSA